MTKRVPKSMDITVTNGMFYAFQDKLSELITSSFLEFRAEIRMEINGVKGEIHGLRTETNELRAEISGMKTEISGLHVKMDRLETELLAVKSDVALVKSKVHNIELLCETQRRENTIALDGARHAIAEVALLRDRLDDETKS